MRRVSEHVLEILEHRDVPELAPQREPLGLAQPVRLVGVEPGAPHRDRSQLAIDHAPLDLLRLERAHARARAHMRRRHTHSYHAHFRRHLVRVARRSSTTFDKFCGAFDRRADRESSPPAVDDDLDPDLADEATARTPKPCQTKSGIVSRIYFHRPPPLPLPALRQPKRNSDQPSRCGACEEPRHTLDPYRARGSSSGGGQPPGPRARSRSARAVVLGHVRIHSSAITQRCPTWDILIEIVDFGARGGRSTAGNRASATSGSTAPPHPASPSFTHVPRGTSPGCAQTRSKSARARIG